MTLADADGTKRGKGFVSAEWNASSTKPRIYDRGMSGASEADRPQARLPMPRCPAMKHSKLLVNFGRRDGLTAANGSLQVGAMQSWIKVHNPKSPAYLRIVDRRS
jgi:hypothetical protein